MTNRKSTKRALLGSVMAMVLCLAMLVGATFAWFTDTASTGVNKIQAGNLDIEIQDETGKAIDTLAWATKDGTAFAEDGKTPLWEPGCTYTLTPFQIVNKGNLALKYKIVVTGLEGDTGLLKVIKFTYKTGEETFDMNTEGHLTANGGASKVITVSAHMDEAAGNEYMNKTLEGVKFTVYATQDTVESDSFNNTYDANATYPVVNVTELKEALTNGGIDTGVNGGYGINVKDGATLTINGGYYYGGGTAVQVQEGTLIINGGTFACEPFGDPYGYNFLINCVDGAYKNGTAKVIIQGGTFINFDPSNDSAEGAAPTSWPMVTRSCLRLRPTATFGILWLLSNSLHQKELSPRNGVIALLMCEVIPTRSRNLFLKQLCLEIICSSSSKNFDYPYYQSYTMGAYQNLIIGDKLSQEAHSSYYRWLVCILAYPCQVFQTISGIFERIKHAHSILANLSANSATIVLAPTIRLCPAYAGQTHAQPWNRRAYTIRQKTVLPHPSNRMRTLC